MNGNTRMAPWLLALAVLGTTALPARAQDGWETIFDDKTLDKWDGNPKFWRVEDGTITGQTTAENPTSGNTFLIWRQLRDPVPQL